MRQTVDTWPVFENSVAAGDAPDSVHGPVHAALRRLPTDLFPLTSGGVYIRYTWHRMLAYS